MSAQLIRRFHALLGQLRMRQHKADILAGYGVESTKDLTEAQLLELVTGLERQRDHRQDAPLEIRRRRAKILDLLTQMGIYKDARSWKRVNEFLLQPRIAGKLLFDMDADELDALRKKLFVIHRKQEEERQKDQYWASQN